MSFRAQAVAVLLCGLVGTAATCGGGGTSELPLNTELDWNEYVGLDPDALLDSSFGHGFAEDRAKVRTYIAIHHPETASGAFSTAWLWDINGEADHAMELYDSCIALYADIRCATNRLGQGELSDDRVMELADQFWAQAATATSFLNNAYFALESEESRVVLLDRAKAELSEGYALWDLMARATDQSNTEEALELYIQATWYPFPVEMFTRILATIERRPAGTETQDVDDAIYMFQALVGTRSPRDAARMARDAGDFFGRMGFYEDALDAYISSFEWSANPHVAESFWRYSRILEDPFEVIDATSRQWMSMFPNDPAMLRFEARYYSEQVWEPERAIEAADRSLELSADHTQRELAQLARGRILEQSGEFNDALDTYRSEPGLATDNMTRLVWNRLYAQDWAGMQHYLDRGYAMTDAPNERFWFALRQVFAAVEPHAAHTISAGDGSTMSEFYGLPNGMVFIQSSPPELWSEENGQLVPRLRFDRCESEAVHSADGAMIACRLDATYSNVNLPVYMIYRTDSGELVDMVTAHSSISSERLALSPSGDVLYIYGSDELIIRHEVGRNRSTVTRVAPTGIGDIALSSDGQSLYVQTPWVDHFFELDATTLNVRRTLFGIDWGHSVAITQDDRYVAVVDNQSQLHVWDRTGANSWSRYSAIAWSLAAHPTNPQWLLRQRSTEDSAPGVIDIGTGNTVASFATAESISAWNEGRIIVVYPDHTDIVDGVSFATLASYPRDAEVVYDVEVDDRNGRLVVNTGSHIVVLDLDDQSELARWPFTGRFERLAGRDDLFVAASDRGIHLVDTYRLTMLSLSQVDDITIQSVAGNDSFVAVAGIRESAYTDETPDEAQIRVYSTQTGDEMWRAAVPVVRGTRYYERLYDSSVTIAMHPTEPLLALHTNWQDGYGHAQTFADEYEIAWFGDNRRVTRQNGSVITGIDFATDGDLVIHESGLSNRYDGASGDYLSTHDVRSDCLGQRIMHSQRFLELQTAAFDIIADAWVPEDIELVYCRETGNELLILTSHNQLRRYSLHLPDMATVDGMKRLISDDVIDLRPLAQP